MFRFPSVICTRCTGFFCLAIIKGPPNDIYCIIEEPYKHYFTEKVSYSHKGFTAQLQLFKLANKSLSLYIFVLALWFYLVLYVFYCPKSIDCTERCYQFVIIFLLSIKNSCNILIPIDDTINFYILVAYLVDNHIIFPYRIFIVCPKADSL